MRPDEFWSLTPREFYLFFQAWAWREHLHRKRAITTAWYTEAFARMKRLKHLRHYVSDHKAKALKPEDAAKARAEFDAAVQRLAPEVAR